MGRNFLKIKYGIGAVCFVLLAYTAVLFVRSSFGGFSGIFTHEHSAAAADWRVLPAGAGGEMLELVGEFVKISPRDPGTTGAAKASRWLAETIRGYGVEAHADSWVEKTAFGPKVFSNIYAEFPGETANTVLFGSHYDTKAGIGGGFQGANDGGSSTAVLLRLIRHFAETKPQLQSTVRFAFFDGEECFGAHYAEDDGLHGSERMAKEFARKRLDTPLVAAIILDMVGDKDQHLQIPRNVTPWLAKLAILEASSGRSDIPPVTVGDIPIIDDHWPFVRRNFSAIDFIDFEYGSAPGRNDYWHTPEDTADKLSPVSLFRAANLALAMLSRIEDGKDVPPEVRSSYPVKPEE